MDRLNAADRLLRLDLPAVAGAAAAAHRNEGFALLIGVVAARLEQTLNGFGRAPDAKDRNALVLLLRLGHHRTRRVVLDAERPSGGCGGALAAHHGEEPPLVEEPRDAERGQVLDRGPPPPGGVGRRHGDRLPVLGGRHPRREKPGPLGFDHVHAQPVQDLVVQLLLRRDRHAGGEELLAPRGYPVERRGGIASGARGEPDDRQDRGHAIDVEFERVGEEILYELEAVVRQPGERPGRRSSRVEGLRHRDVSM